MISIGTGVVWMGSRGGSDTGFRADVNFFRNLYKIGSVRQAKAN